MGINSLRYLESSGIKWELYETPQIVDMFKKQTIGSGAKELTLNNEMLLHKNVIAPSLAPITLQESKRCAANANNLQELITAIDSFNHPLKQFAKTIVLPDLADPDSQSGLLIITDLPSSDDEISGKILTGKAGDMIDKMLSAIEISRASVCIAPLLFWRTPGGRAPSREEIDLSKPFISKIIDLYHPKAILTLGTLAAAEIAGVRLPHNHGKPFGIENKVTVVPIYHPNYIMLKPDVKREVWDAVKKLQNLLKTATE